MAGQKKQYDIVLKDGKTKTGLMLFEQEGRKMWEVTQTPTMAPELAVGSPNYGHFSPRYELIWAKDSFSGGFGAYKDVPDRYFMSENINCTRTRQVTLGPLVNVTAQSGGAALGQNTHWSDLVEFDDNLYYMTDDGTDVKVWKWDITNNYWTEVLDCGFGMTGHAGGLCNFGDYIVALCAGMTFYSEDGSTWVAIGVGEESYTVDNDGTQDLWGVNWEAQIFTLNATAIPLDRVQILAYRVGSPGTVTLSIRATGGAAPNKSPTGADLDPPSTGTFDGDTITDNTSGEWITVNLTSPWTGTASTSYAIVARATSGDVNNKIMWCSDDSSPAYTDGNRSSSANSGAAWTASSSEDLMFNIFSSGQGSMATVRDTLWRVETPNRIYSCTDPTATGNWTESTETIGDAQADIKSLLNLANTLYVGKEDGLYSFDAQTVTNLIPDYRCIKHSKNFQIGQAFHNEGYFAVGDSGLIHYDAGTITDLSPLLFGPKVSDIGHRVEAETRDENFLYAMLYPKTQGTEFYILAGRWQTLGGSPMWAWHPIIKVDTENVATIGLRSMLVTTVEGNPWLWAGESGTTKWKPGYWILPAGHLTPANDSTCTFSASGNLITSWYDGGLIDVEKSFQFLRVKADDTSADETITCYYEVDDSASWTEVGGTGSGIVDEDGWTTLNFEEGITGKKIRLKLTLARGNTTTNTPVFEAFALHCVLRPEVKRMFNFVVRCADKLPTRTIPTDTQKAADIVANLWTYREATAPITLEDVDGVEHKVELINLRETYIGKEEIKAAERVIELQAMKVAV